MPKFGYVILVKAGPIIFLLKFKCLAALPVFSAVFLSLCRYLGNGYLFLADPVTVEILCLVYSQLLQLNCALGCFQLQMCCIH
ncbi:hypothetical protein VNO77_40601 [Canavalia gladiata]|uniref:Uncharacterized protein n=1 Tax=Canavalia gladiata TaxID=3824 RepID=A0AAN9PPP1_CANGL